MSGNMYSLTNRIIILILFDTEIDLLLFIPGIVYNGVYSVQE